MKSSINCLADFGLFKLGFKEERGSLTQLTFSREEEVPLLLKNKCDQTGSFIFKSYLTHSNTRSILNNVFLKPLNI